MAEQAGLENRSPSRDRGFKSHPLRQFHHAVIEFVRQREDDTPSPPRVCESELVWLVP